MAAQRVLIVDDDPKILRFVGASLRQHGFEVLTAHDGDDALDQAAAHPPDLVVLDLNMPGRSGLEVLKEFREWSGAPVIVLSAQDDEQTKVAALDLGADDYLTKPFGVPELLARIRAALRRAIVGIEAKSPMLEAGPVRIDQAQRQASYADTNVTLTRTEYELLRTFVSEVGKALTHEQLLERVWGPEYRDEIDILRTFIKQLRKKIEPNPAKPQHILTIPGVGYRFVGAAP